jgi:anti-anti-sigma factor
MRFFYLHFIGVTPNLPTSEIFPWRHLNWCCRGDWEFMSEFHRIDISYWESGEKRVTIVEILDGKLWGPTLLQELVHELSTFLQREKHKDVLLDLRNVDYISSAALNRLLNFRKYVLDAGGRFKLCNLQPSVEEVFVTTRFNQILDIYPNQDDALAAY